MEQADRNGNRLTIERGPTGQLQRIVGPAGRALEVTFTGSRLAQVREPLGRTVQYAYDGGGRLTSVTDPAGGVTTGDRDVGRL